MQISKRELATIAMAAAAWLCVYGCVAPPFGGADVFIFKDAGANLALGHGFNSIPAPFFDGSSTTMIFSSYTPLYPLLYGAWAAVFGIGPYANAYFDLCLASVAMILVLKLVLPSVQSAFVRQLLIITAVIALPAGGVFLAVDRPEVLAYGLTLLLLAAWVRVPRFRHSAPAIGGSAIVFLAHPFAGLILLLVLSYLTLTDPTAECGKNAPKSRLLSVIGGWCLFSSVLFAVGAVFVLLDQHALERFSQHALGTGSGAGVMRRVNGIGDLLPFYKKNWRHAFLSSSIASMTMAGSLLVCTAVLLPFAGLLLARTQGWREQCSRGLFVCFVVGLLFVPILLFPRQNNYYSYVRALVPMVVLASQSEAAKLLRARHVPAMLLTIGWLFCLPNIAIAVITRVENLGSYRDMTARAPELLAPLQGAYLAAVSSDLYYVVKPIDQNIVCIDYVTDKNAAKIDAVVAAHAGLPPSQARSSIKQELNSGSWRVLTPESEPVVLSILGKQIMRSQWGWSFDAYMRTAEAVHDQ
jgi:hypothetical protein